jgi:hypothetical protein
VGYKPNRKPPAKERVNEGRDGRGISTESHMEMFRRLVKAGDKGIHNAPGESKKKRG